MFSRVNIVNVPLCLFLAPGAILAFLRYNGVPFSAAGEGGAGRSGVTGKGERGDQWTKMLSRRWLAPSQVLSSP